MTLDTAPERAVGKLHKKSAEKGAKFVQLDD